jgi:ribonuclease HI
MSKVIVFTDGGARGNPGPAAYGVFIQDEQKKRLASFGKVIGVTTNNVAEYTAIVEAFNWLLANKEKYGFDSVDFFMDSQLACSQLKGIFKIKNPRIREFVFEIRQKEQELSIPIAYSHVPREQNKQADLMVNQALDNISGSY